MRGIIREETIFIFKFIIIFSKIGSFEGVWHKYLDIDGKRKWNFEELIAP